MALCAWERGCPNPWGQNTSGRRREVFCRIRRGRDARPARAPLPNWHDRGVESLAGMLLVAPPPLTDPNFVESVVVVLLHNENGAFGLVLNQPTELDVDHAVPSWTAVAGLPVRCGGPVETGALIGIGRPAPGSTPSGYQAIETPTLGPIGLIDLHGEPTDAVLDVRLFAGYTGWGPGQLDGEVMLGGWVVVPGLPSDAFDQRTDTLWGRVLRRADREDPSLRLMPDDITFN